MIAKNIQLIFDPFACCSYIINYIKKPQRGISKRQFKPIYFGYWDLCPGGRIMLSGIGVARN